MENSCIKDIISDSLNQVRTIVDADTIVGKQIVTPSGVVIIPISKVSMGFASGGLDIPNKKAENNVKNFGGGGGTGVTVTPVGFLVVSPNGNVNMLPMTAEKTSTVEQVADIINNAPSVLERLKNVLMDLIPAKEEDAATAAENEKLEKAYREKLVQDAADEVVAAQDEVNKLKQEAEAIRRMEKRGKISEKTLEQGEVK